MQHYEHYVSSIDTTFKLVVCGSPAFHSALIKEPFWNEFVPSFKNSKVSHPKLTWLVKEAISFDYSIKNHTIETPIAMIKRLVVVIEASFEKARQNKSIFTLHGSAISKNNQSVVFIGNVSGTGKTSMASYAANYGWKWIADDKFSICRGAVIGGTNSLLSDTKTRDAASQNTPVPIDKEYRIALICQPIVTNEIALTKHIMSREKAQWVLYDEVTRDIRQVNGIVHDQLPVLDSMDNEKLARQRIKAVDSLARSIPVFFLRGPKQLILNEIISVYEK